MKYIIDSNSLSSLKHYYPDQFPTLWSKLDEAIACGILTSVKEVLGESYRPKSKEHLDVWISRNKGIFKAPQPEEMRFVAQIFEVRKFRELIEEKKQIRGGFCADPFVIASAYALNASLDEAMVVTEEKFKPNSSKIPNICEHFELGCTNFQGMMQREGWVF